MQSGLAPHETTAKRATEIGTIGLVVSVALFVAGIVVGEGHLAATASPALVAATFVVGAGALLGALGCVLYLADVAAITVTVATERLRHRS